MCLCVHVEDETKLPQPDHGMQSLDAMGGEGEVGRMTDGRKLSATVSESDGLFPSLRSARRTHERKSYKMPFRAIVVGSFTIRLTSTLMVRIVLYGITPLNSLRIKFSKFPPLQF